MHDLHQVPLPDNVDVTPEQLLILQLSLLIVTVSGCFKIAPIQHQNLTVIRSYDIGQAFVAAAGERVLRNYFGCFFLGDNARPHLLLGLRLMGADIFLHLLCSLKYLFLRSIDYEALGNPVRDFALQGFFLHFAARAQYVHLSLIQNDNAVFSFILPADYLAWPELHRY